MDLEVDQRIIRPGHPSTRVTFQLAARIGSLKDESPEVIFDGAVEPVLGWIRGKFPTSLPTEATQGHSFEAELPGQAVRCVAVPEDGLWTARLVQPDAPYKDQPAVAGRTWTTDVSLHRTEAAVTVGIRAFCASLPYAIEGIRLTRPFVVVELASRFALSDVRRLDGAPWRLASPGDLAAFRDFLTDPRRTLPVYLLTQPSQTRLGVATAQFLLDEVALSQRTQGMAYVATLPMALGFQWTEMVGKPWSAYLGAERTYRPGLRFDDGSPFEHPLKMAEGVLAFRYGERTAEDAFTEMLVEQAHRHVVTMRVDWGDIQFLEDAHIRRAALARASATDESTRGALLALEVDALGAKILRVEEERELALKLAAESEAAKLAADDEVGRLRAQLDALRRALRKTGKNPDALLRFPETYPEVEEWVRINFPGRLVLHPRAVRGLRGGQFDDVVLVGKALLMLANEYRSMCLGEPGANDTFTAAYERLGLRFGRSIARERAGEEGETYFVRMGRGEPERRFLEFHLRKGGDKDARYCLAIYFFWDEESEQVVVGWLPSHLENRMT